MRWIRLLPHLVCLAIGLIVGTWLMQAQPVHALPEYAERTGEPCTTCHINPAGGGPRTERGMLWLALGKPDAVPTLPSPAKPTPASQGGEAAALFTSLQCAGCHGADGSGGLGPPLNTGELTAEGIHQVVRQGKGAMPPYDSRRLSDADLDLLIAFIQGLGAAPAGAPVEILTCGGHP